MKENCSSSAISEEDKATLLCVVWMISPTLRHIFYVTVRSSLEKNVAAVFTEPAMYALLRLNCNTYSHAIHGAGGIAFVRKKRVTDLLSVRTIVGFVASQTRCANSENAL